MKLLKKVRRKLGDDFHFDNGKQIFLLIRCYLLINKPLYSEVNLLEIVERLEKNLASNLMYEHISEDSNIVE